MANMGLTELYRGDNPTVEYVWTAMHLRNLY